MAYSGKKIENPMTGQSIQFLRTAKDTGGALLEMETTYRSASTPPIPHYHPHQDEHFTVIKGELTLMTGRKMMVLKEGEQIRIPRGQHHAMWNASSSPTIVNWKVSPALETENLLEIVMGLSAAGKVNRKGMPSILQMSILAPRFSKVYRISQPARWLQLLVFGVLKPFALLSGHQADFKNLEDQE